MIFAMPSVKNDFEVVFPRSLLTFWLRAMMRMATGMRMFVAMMNIARTQFDVATRTSVGIHFDFFICAVMALLPISRYIQMKRTKRPAAMKAMKVLVMFMDEVPRDADAHMPKHTMPTVTRKFRTTFSNLPAPLSNMTPFTRLKAQRMKSMTEPTMGEHHARNQVVFTVPHPVRILSWTTSGSRMPLGTSASHSVQAVPFLLARLLKKSYFSICEYSRQSHEYSSFRVSSMPESWSSSL
mmetsp:Transcript_825/g.2050  ORF Transcript_825/g.2050 Transcript_825/m.2050 type:complete len:239 (+) Transcript_825:1630-2346(+)